MKYIKTFEDINQENYWMIDINNIIDKKLLNKLSDISDKVKKGDVIIGVWFNGFNDAYLLKVDEIDIGEEEPSLGASDGESVYDIDYAWGVFDYEEYKKLDPYFYLKLATNKYNL